MEYTTLKVGERFNRLVIIESGSVRLRKSHYLVKCDCGTITQATGWHMRNGRTKSCGCLREENRKRINATHRMSGSAEFKIWCGIKARCEIPSATGFKNYGARGIQVCERWQSFENFFADMGTRPKGMSIDRVDNGGNYEPSNCRWATRREQSANSRRIVPVTCHGVTKSISEWARVTGINYYTLQARLKKSGWTPEKALDMEVLHEHVV